MIRILRGHLVLFRIALAMYRADRRSMHLLPTRPR